MYPRYLIDELYAEIDNCLAIECAIDRTEDGPEQGLLCIELGMSRDKVNQLTKLIND